MENRVEFYNSLGLGLHLKKKMRRWRYRCDKRPKDMPMCIVLKWYVCTLVWFIFTLLHKNITHVTLISTAFLFSILCHGYSAKLISKKSENIIWLEDKIRFFWHLYEMHNILRMKSFKRENQNGGIGKHSTHHCPQPYQNYN